MKFLHQVLLFVFVATGSNVVAENNVISNPMIPGYFADPSIVVENSKFYCYATIDPWGGDSLAFWVSDDLKNLIRKPLNWQTKPQCTSKTSNDSKVWSPGVIRGKDGKYHIFVSVGSEVYADVSDCPGGPWKNVKAEGVPFIATQKTINVHIIDAEVFLDEDGKAYIYWGSGWDWKDGHCFVAALNESVDALVTPPKDITPPGYFEAPHMLKRNEQYYLMYSDGKCTDSTYKVRYAVANNPIGPWVEGKNSPVLSSDLARNIIGPGHHSILFYKKKYYIVYHRIANVKSLDAKDLLREICIDELNFDQAGNIKKVTPSQKGFKNFVSLKKQPE